jgi:hypothetical protein
MMNRDFQTGGSSGGDLQPTTRDSYGYPPAVQLPDPVAGHFAEPEHFADLTGYLRILRKHKGTVLVFAFLGALVGLIVLLPQPPIYRASASVEVQPLNDEFLYSKDVNPNAGMNGMYPEYDMATQVKVLETRSRPGSCSIAWWPGWKMTRSWKFRPRKIVWRPGAKRCICPRARRRRAPI